MIISIDGPSGTGKGTIAERISKHFNYEHLDSGIFYRCVAYYILNNNIDLNDEKSILNFANNMIIKISDKVYLNEIDVTKEIRSNEVDNIVGEVSKITNLRKIINELIRNYVKDKNIIVDGRDIGSIVLPNANFKIFLKASIDARTQRRYKQNIDNGIFSNYDNVYENIKKRDKIDLTRDYGKLEVADDAYVIDTSNLSIEDTIKLVINYIEGEVI